MNENVYPFTLSRTEFRYEFVSVSAKKEVRKIVLLSQTKASNFYNLALLDLLENGDLSDLAETNNEDLKTVMATVIQITIDFFVKMPDCYVIFKGNDNRRQRLYRILISRELTEITKKFKFFGGIGDSILEFETNTFYEFYLIKKI